MHDQVVSIPAAEGRSIDVLFTHAAFCRLEQQHGFRIVPLIDALGAHSVIAIEAALLCGVEGHREAVLKTGKLTTVADVRALLDGPLEALQYSDLVNYLCEAVTRGARRGKATAATTTPT